MISLQVSILYPRRWLILPGMALHGLFYVLMPVDTFSLTMWLLYLAYIDTDAVERVIERLGGRGVCPPLLAHSGVA